MKHVKLKPSETTVDHRYQRDLDQRRMETIAAAYDPRLVGVPVISRRPDGSLVRLDGQHRLAAALASGHGDEPMLMEVHDGLDIHDEAELFLRLNGGRTAVGAVDKYRAELAARVPTSLEIQAILKNHGCKITRSPQQGGIMAVTAVKSAYHAGNLSQTVQTLYSWLDGDSTAFDQKFVRAVSQFYCSFPHASPKHLADRLSSWDETKLWNKMKREFQKMAGTAGAMKDAAVVSLMEIYNHRTGVAKRVSMAPPHTETQAAVN